MRHLMKSRLLTRYNLAFLQALLWRVGNKNLCLQVAQFARTCSQKPVYFYSPPKKADFHEDIPSQDQVLERELKRRMETEQHLKHCLYEEQVSNENLKDIQTGLEQRLHDSEETTKELNRWYMRVFAALLVSFHFIAELLKDKRGLLVRRSQQFVHEVYNAQFLDAFAKAKRCSCNPDSLMQLVEATKLMEHLKDRDEIDYLRELTNASLTAMQRNLNEAVTMRMTERRLGMFQRLPTPDEMRQASIVVYMLSGLLRLHPVLEGVLGDLVNRLDEAQLKKICKKFNVPENIQTNDLKSRIIVYIIFSEVDKRGKQASMAETDAIVEACFREAGRKDLWKEYESVSKSIVKQQEEQRKAHSRKEEDITDRLEKIEKMLQAAVGQTFIGNMRREAFNGNGISGDPRSFQNLYEDIFKGPKFPFDAYAQHENK